MIAYPIDPAPATVVPIIGSDARFPVRRVYCVGRNYAAHRREMGGDDRDPPFFFAKPADAITPPGTDVAYPPATIDLHHEIELVAALKGGGSDVSSAEALGLVFGYGVGVDLTRRDLQNAAKAKGQPWDAAKGFDASGPISALRPWTGSPPNGRIWLAVDGQVRQDALIADMIWNVAEIIAQASKLWRLAPGDLIFTGTPEGVGPITRGQAITGGIDGVGDITFRIR